MRICLCFLLFFSTTIFATEIGESCAKLDNDQARLEYYDTTFKKTSEVVKTKWIRDIRKDEFSGISFEYALLESSNQNISQPGLKTASLVLQGYPDYGIDKIMFFIHKSVFHCSNSCSVEYKFDDGKISNLVCHRMSNNSPNQVECNLDFEVREKFKNHHTMMVRLPLYAENLNTFTFDIDNFPFVGVKSFSEGELRSLLSNGQTPAIKKSLVKDKEYSFSSIKECKKTYQRYLKANFPISLSEDTKKSFSYIEYWTSKAIKHTCILDSEKEETFIYE